jgi:SAM-dependent methyltransferase
MNSLKSLKIASLFKKFLFRNLPLETTLKDCLSHNPSLNFLDVGCGNHSPTRYKSLYPQIVYTGVDIAEYNLDENDKKIADNLIILNCESDDFANQIDSSLVDLSYDFIVMNHVIEHTKEPLHLLSVLSKKLLPNGIFYLAFPCSQSIYFPSAHGTLNFYDDPTHVWIPSTREILNTLVDNECNPLFFVDQYKPFPESFVGLVLLIKELVKATLFRCPMRVHYFIWCFYGFESIIVVRKK